jgi:hypothetical protein
MNDKEQMQEQMATLVQERAVSFPYPPTPDIAGQVRRRLTSPPPHRWQTRLAWALVVVLMAMGLLLTVPQVRAAVFEIIRAGAITIFVGEPTPTAVPTTPVSEEGLALPLLETVVTEITGLTRLEDAQTQMRFPLRQPPAYGPPDEVYLQKIADPDLDGQVAIMVWLDPVQPERAHLRLYQIGMAFYGLKRASIEAVEQTEVNRQTAYWVEGGHQIQLPNEQEQESYFVEDNVLIWVEGEITYRLESDLSLAEAVQVAESLMLVEEGE